MCNHSSGFSRIPWMKQQWVWVCNLNCGYFSEYAVEEESHAASIVLEKSEGTFQEAREQSETQISGFEECHQDVPEGVLSQGDLFPIGGVSISLLESKEKG